MHWYRVTYAQSVGTIWQILFKINCCGVKHLRMGWIWNFIRIEYRISSKCGVRIEYRIEYEYYVASNSIGILNGVDVSWRDAASSPGIGHKSVPESSASIFLFIFWPSHENDFLQSPNLSHILCTYKHTSKEYNLKKLALNSTLSTGSTQLGDYRNIGNLSQSSLNKWPSQIPVLC